MADARRSVSKAINSNVGSLILMALVFSSCVANGEYLGGRRGLAAVAAATPNGSAAASPTGSAANSTAASPTGSAAASPTGSAANGTAASPTGSAANGTAASPAGSAAVGLTSAAGGPTGTVFDITKFGAVGDGATNSFKAFLEAWIQVCASTQPATLLVPKGDFLVGPVIFAGPCKSKITVTVEGTIIATTSGFPNPEWFLFEHVDNVVVNGKGTFHGKGEAVWKPDGCGSKVNCNLGPTSIKFRNMKNVDISGISSVNAKAFHMFLVNIDNVSVKDIKLTAPAESPNTDGIHLSNAVGVSITDSIIATGDDCVSVGKGCTNVTVERVTCGPGHGLSVGSLGKYKGEEDVSGIHVRNCTMIETDNGLRIKTWGGSDPSKATDITFEDIIMRNVKNPIIIDQNYGSRGGDSQVAISNVLFKNVKGTTITKDVVQLMCSKAVPCTGVDVEDVDLKLAGSGVVGAVCTNAKTIFGGVLSFPMCPK